MARERGMNMTTMDMNDEKSKYQGRNEMDGHGMECCRVFVFFVQYRELRRIHKVGNRRNMMDPNS